MVIARAAKRVTCGYCNVECVVDRGEGSEPVSPGERVIRVARGGATTLVTAIAIPAFIFGVTFLALLVNYLVNVLFK